MSNIPITPITSGYNITKINGNFSAIADMVNNHVLHTDGGQNVMNQQLDMNGNAVINVGLDASNPNSLLSVSQGDLRYYQQHNVSNPTMDLDATNRAYVENLLAGVVGGSGYFLQNGAGAVARTFQDKERDIVSVKDYGVTGNGTTDDTAALLVAVATGKDLLFPPGTYKVSAGLVLSSGQTLKGSGTTSTVIQPTSGSFDILTWTGGAQGGGIHDISINATSITGGNALVVNNANRIYIHNLVILNPYNGIYVQTANVVGLRDIWINAVRGTYCVKWYGNNANRSDVLDISNVQVSGYGSPTATSPVGLLIDGNVNTADVRHFATVNCLRGVHILNTSGGNNFQFFTGYDVQSDYSYAETFRFEGGARTIFLTDCYSHGSLTADGIYIDPSVQNVSIQGGQIDSNWLRGINAQGRYTKVSNCNISTNSQAGSGLWPGVEIGAGSYGTLLHGNLIGQWLGYSAEKQSYGVLIDVGAQAYSLVGNDFRLNTLGDFLDNAHDGTSTIIGNATASSSYSIVPSPLQSQSGDMQLYASSNTNQVVLANPQGYGFSAQALDPTSVNYLKASGHATGIAPTLGAVGADTNINLGLSPKGLGLLNIQNAASFATGAVTPTGLGTTAPAGAHATPQTWLQIIDSTGATRYIPCY
jgi:hypothetical protein